MKMRKKDIELIELLEEKIALAWRMYYIYEKENDKPMMKAYIHDAMAYESVIALMTGENYYAETKRLFKK